jgi:Ala-tRNA(Pro) deacylase
MISPRLKAFLEELAVPYHIIVHRRDYTAQEAAADTHTRGRDYAKTVVLSVDGEYVEVVLPAPERLDLGAIRRQIGARDVRLASEEELRRLCPDCEIGAEPPFGNLYGVPVFMSRDLTFDDEITFNGGSHEDAVRMRTRDFERVVHPRVVDLH